MRRMQKGSHRSIKMRQKQSATRIAHGVAKGRNNPMFGRVTSGAFKKGHVGYNRGKTYLLHLKKLNEKVASLSSLFILQQPTLLANEHYYKKKKPSPERSRKLTGRTVSAETRRKLSETGKKVWSIKEFRRNRILTWKDSHPPEVLREIMKRNCMKPNKAELQLQQILDSLFPSLFKYVGDGTLFIDGLCPDFINCNGQKQIIELFGQPFHDPRHTFVKRVRDRQTAQGRIETFGKYGYSTLIVWDRELKSRGELEQKIINFVEGGKYE